MMEILGYEDYTTTAAHYHTTTGKELDSISLAAEGFIRPQQHVNKSHLIDDGTIRCFPFIKVYTYFSLYNTLFHFSVAIHNGSFLPPETDAA